MIRPVRPSAVTTSWLSRRGATTDAGRARTERSNSAKPGRRVGQELLEALQLGGHRPGAGPASGGSAGYRHPRFEEAEGLAPESRMRLHQLAQGNPPLEGGPDQTADHRMSVPERHAPLDQP